MVYWVAANSMLSLLFLLSYFTSQNELNLPTLMINQETFLSWLQALSLIEELPVVNVVMSVVIFLAFFFLLRSCCQVNLLWASLLQVLILTYELLVVKTAMLSRTSLIHFPLAILCQEGTFQYPSFPEKLADGAVLRTGALPALSLTQGMLTL